MTGRQRFLKFLQPLVLRLSRLTGHHHRILKSPGSPPRSSIYDLTVMLGSGGELPLANFRGAKLLLVNTASDCIYTGQYRELQSLAERAGQSLQIIGFPSNDFKEQERGNDGQIAGFCQVNYGVTFPIAHKGAVLPGPDQQPVFKWLTDPARNGWNSQPPAWNFSKYLINEQGALTHYFDPAVSLHHPEFVSALGK